METTPIQKPITTIDLVQTPPRASGWPWTVVQAYLVIAVPVLLTLISVRLVMMPWFVEFEYNRAGFPEDRYGMTTEERMEYAPYALNYLVNGADISYLGDLTFPDGSSLYNSRELHHMEDVKVVTRNAFFLLFYGGIVTILISAVLAARPQTRHILRLGLLQGSVLTLSVILLIILVAIAMWDFFFTAFHQIFFESGTWRFAFSDTLIRLFPEQFWFDAALTIGAMTTIGALFLLAVTWRWSKRATQVLPE